jgi:hypothetical protein
MTAQATALNITSSSALNALNAPLNLTEVQSRVTPVESMGHTFKAKFGGTCALSGIQILAGMECRMVMMRGWAKPRCAANTAYGAVANCGWTNRGSCDDPADARWTGRLLASQVTAEEVLDLLAQIPGGIILRTWETSQLYYNGEHHSPGHTWRYDAASKKYIHSGIGGAKAKTRAQALRCILGAKVFACTIG